MWEGLKELMQVGSYDCYLPKEQQLSKQSAHK